MSKSLSTIRLGLVIAALLLMGIGLLYAAKIIEAEFAREIAITALSLAAVFTIGTIVISLAAGDREHSESLTDGHR